ncbi:MAG: hypothetical protein MUO61_03415 [Dehalococcoidia bacterium]|nr:hypothetical protein [Dehalococcoidia bacterium]
MKGILFRPEIWQAELEVLKHGEAQTRRVIKPQPDMGLPEYDRYSHINVGKYHPTKIGKDGEEYPGDEIFGAYTDDGEWGWRCPYQVGEVVYVKEAWATFKALDNIPIVRIKDATIFYAEDFGKSGCTGKHRSPIHLPERFARSFIKITDVRAERLQEISEGDAQDEGVTYYDDNAVDVFMELWGSINPKYPWESNPWVFVYSFIRVEMPGD